MAGYIGSQRSVVLADVTAGSIVPADLDRSYLESTGGTLTGAVTGTDLTLSGGVYLGGTGSANYLDDYEEGTWTPTNYTGIKLLPTYTKVGNMVRVSVYLYGGSFTSATIGGLPFLATSNNYSAVSMGNFTATNINSGFATGAGITFRSGTTDTIPNGGYMMINVTYMTDA